MQTINVSCVPFFFHLCGGVYIFPPYPPLDIVSLVWHFLCLTLYLRIPNVTSLKAKCILNTFIQYLWIHISNKYECMYPFTMDSCIECLRILYPLSSDIYIQYLRILISINYIYLYIQYLLMHISTNYIYLCTISMNTCIH